MNEVSTTTRQRVGLPIADFRLPIGFIAKRRSEIRKPTPYRVVVTSSQLLNSRGLNCRSYVKKKRGGPNIRSASSLKLF